MHRAKKIHIYHTKKNATPFRNIDVYRPMGCSLLEAVYQDCLDIDFAFERFPSKARRRFDYPARVNALNRSIGPISSATARSSLS